MTNISDGTSEAEFQAQLEKVEPATFQAYATAHPHLVRLIEKAQQGNLLAARDFARATGMLAAPKGASPSQIWELSKLQSGWADMTMTVEAAGEHREECVIVRPTWITR